MKTYRTFALGLMIVLIVALAMPTALAQDEVTVTWWTETGGIPPNIQEVFITPFEEAHPGIKIDLVGQEELDTVLRTAIQAGAAPDILQTPGASFIAESVSAGVVEPLDSYATQYGWQDKLLSWAYQSGILNDTLYSVPLTYESMILVYNKTLFDEQGWSPPTTFDELNAVADAAVAAGINPFAYGNVGWQGNNEHIFGVYLNNYAGPENLYKALIGEKSWTDPEFVGATELLREHLAVNGWFSGSLENYFAVGWEDFMAELSSGEAAMMMTGSWVFRFADDYFGETGAEWDWTPLPPFSDMAGEYNYELATGSTLSINAASERKDEAAMVLDFLLSDPERSLELSSSVGFGEWMVPVHISEEDFPEGTDPRFVRFFSDFAKVTGEGRIGYTTWTFWPAGAELQLRQAIESVWYEDMTAEDFMAGQQAEWDAARASGEVLPVPAPGM